MEEPSAVSSSNESKLPFVLVQKLSVGEKIFADGREVGISVSEEHCETPEFFVFSSEGDSNSSLREKRKKTLLNASQPKISLKENGEKRLYQCSTCDYSSYRKDRLDTHQISHSDERPFACPSCSYKAKRNDHLQRHVLRHFSSVSSLLECPKCTFKTIDNVWYKKHTLGHSTEKILDFEEDCSKNQRDENNLSNTDDNTKLIKCSKCDFESKHQYSMKQHMSKKHLDVEPFHFIKSEFTTSEEKNDDKNQKPIVDKLSKTREVLNIFKCSKCDFKTKHQYSVKRHMSKMHLDVEPFHFITSEFTTSEEKNDEKNQKPVVDKLSKTRKISNIFKCSKCDFKTKHQRSLKRHMPKKHFDMEPLHCTKCEFTTNEKGKFESHVQSHIETKLLSSSSSNFKTELGETLDSHLENNPKDNGNDISEHPDAPSGRKCLKLHICPHCDFRTIIKHSFERHILKHPISKQFKCEYCNYETQKRSALTNHLAKHKTTKSLTNSEGIKAEEMEVGTSSKIEKMEVDASSSGKHMSEPSFQCPDSNFKTKRKRAFISHASQHRKKTLLRSFDCDFEGFQENDLDPNISSELQTKTVQFSDSENSNSSPKNLKTKKMKVEDKKIQHNANTVKHEQKQENWTLWQQCPKCNFKANSKRFMDSHLRTHEVKEGVLECSVCNYRTLSKQNLQVHMLRHSR